MKRPSLPLRIVLSVFLLLAPVVARAEGAAGDQRTYRIYMILWRGWEEASQGFKDYFANRNLRVELIIRNAGQDRARLPGFVAEAKSLKPDLVYAWGTTVSLDVFGTYDAVDPSRHITDIPAIFAIVSEPVGSRLVPSLESSGRNITGTTYLVPMETQLKTIGSFRKFRRLAIIYSPLERNSLDTLEELNAAALREGFEIVAEPLRVDENRRVAVDSIAEKVALVAAAKPDFLYIPPDTFLNVNRDRLTQAALAHRIPTFAAAEAPVRSSSALIGLVSRYYNVGQLTGYKAEQILLGRLTPAQMPIDSLKRYSLLVNMRVAGQLEIYPPMSLLKFAEVVR